MRVETAPINFPEEIATTILVEIETTAMAVLETKTTPKQTVEMQATTPAIERLPSALLIPALYRTIRTTFGMSAD